MSLYQNNILLLTATIQPMEGLPNLTRTDPLMRLQDYKRTLQAYLSLLKSGVIGRIVFAENSNAMLTVLKDMVAEGGVADRVEFISFYGLDFDPAKGRGFGEFKLVDFAMSTAHCLRNNPDAVVWKCTGRYVILNLDKIISTSANFDLLCHCRNYPKPWCELYLLAWNRRGYEGLIRGLSPRLANDLMPGMHTIEETLFRPLVDQASKTMVVIRRFGAVPLIDGIRGYNNTRYSDRWYSPKLMIRRAFAYLLPSVWI